MEHIAFTDDMLKMLSELKGEVFWKYVCADEIYAYAGCEGGAFRVYGNLRMYTSKGAFEIKNEDELFPFFGGEEDVACLSFRKVDPENPFKPMCIEPLKTVNVGKKITGVEVIRDVIRVGDGVYDATVDLAVVIRTETKTYMFARDIWFSEVLTIAEYDDYEKIYPIENAKEDWSDYGDYEVDIQRTRIIL